MKNFIFWALTSHGPGISGGDRIYIEFARRWSKKYPLEIVTWKEGIDMMQRNGLSASQKITISRLSVPNLGFLTTYLMRIAIGLLKSLALTLEHPKSTYLYSASEFWMDSIPCFVLKLRYPKLHWVASWYQTAPSPISGFGLGRHRASALLLWLSQLPIRPLIQHFADYVLVNNDEEKKIFPGKKVVVVLGAVDIQKLNIKLYPLSTKKYAAVFQGRFHPQKGVVELVEIWRNVVNQLPSAKLAMIGDGPLMSKVREKIKLLDLEKNIELFGFVFDGSQKYRIFSQSKLVVHPAFFDSGGMATAEAMAFGLPAIGFDLPAFTSYYPVGMVKIPTGELDTFANSIVSLLSDPKKIISLGQKAKRFIFSHYSWDRRADQVLNSLTANI